MFVGVTKKGMIILLKNYQYVQMQEYPKYWSVCWLDLGGCDRIKNAYVKTYVICACK